MKRSDFEQAIAEVITLYPNSARSVDKLELESLWHRVERNSISELKEALDLALEDSPQWFPSANAIIQKLKRARKLSAEDKDNQAIKEKAQQLADEARREYEAEFERYSDLYGVPVVIGKERIFRNKKYCKHISSKTWVMKIDYVLDRLGVGKVNELIFSEFKVKTFHHLLKLLGGGAFPSKRWDKFLDELVGLADNPPAAEWG